MVFGFSSFCLFLCTRKTYGLTGSSSITTIVCITEHGEAQARGIGATLMNVEFGDVFCSPLFRARQTLELINGQREDGMNLEERTQWMDELKEINVPPWHGMLKHEIQVRNRCICAVALYFSLGIGVSQRYCLFSLRTVFPSSRENIRSMTCTEQNQLSSKWRASPRFKSFTKRRRRLGTTSDRRIETHRVSLSLTTRQTVHCSAVHSLFLSADTMRSHR